MWPCKVDPTNVQEALGLCTSQHGVDRVCKSRLHGATSANDILESLRTRSRPAIPNQFILSALSSLSLEAPNSA